MAKITEKLLLEKGSPKTDTLENIKTLNLSKMALKVQDLPVKLLSGLHSLQWLDLSGNRLHEFPKNLKLPALRYLDLSDNQMEDVTALESLSSLEELKMEANLYITVSDNHKMMVMLPNLRIYNNKDISINAHRLRGAYRDTLRTKIIALWGRSFRLPDPITAEKLSKLETDFVNTARQQIKFGPSSVSDFTKWLVEIIAKEYLRSLTEPKKEPESSKSAEIKENGVRIQRLTPLNTDSKDSIPPVSCGVNGISLPTKRKKNTSEMDSNINLTPPKKQHTDVIENSPCKSGIRLKPLTRTNPVRMTPQKSSQPPSTPTRGQKTDTPRRVSRAANTKGDGAQVEKKEETNKKDPKGTKLKQETDVLSKYKSCSNTQPVCLKPLHVLQCHSKQDSSEDFSTQLWACAFQPLPVSTGGSGGSRLVATCGGDSLCVIDCETGMVMKKYKVSGEEFFSLAWSTVLMSRGSGASAQHCSILAAGGKRGVVKLIHPRNNMAYGEFRASRKALSALCFNHHKGNLLFTGSYDNKIGMWDIGGVDSQYNFKVVQLLVFELSAVPLHICLPPTSPSAHLLTACEDGLYCFNTALSTNNTAKSRSKDIEITFPIYKKEDKDHDYHTVDGLSFLSDDIVASKNYLHGSIYLWSWTRTKAQQPDRKSMTVCAVVLAELQWTNTEIPYLALNTCPGQAYIVCGDDKGRLWTYHVTNLQKHSFQTGKPILPTEVLEWPMPVRSDQSKVEGPSINGVAMDPELHYLVALSDKNMVIVWKREESL
ncbi:leucine-rich repeat and WD repeat-containing protein 1 [Echeneis naucrates]|uniref:leucine-rich repeat and WD repeat-containing protein 1 n=1 Tax=Echeneis naucrates TaxID=173247 RepID=UPI001113FC48|nr:leucine-rich repeat and WD repeat-containing protein 1 [Echeneis naucrates]